MKKSLIKVIFALSIVYSLLLELLFYLSEFKSVFDFRNLMAFYSVFPLIFIIVSIIIDIYEKSKKNSLVSIYLPAMLVFYYLLFGILNFFYAFSSEFLMFIIFIVIPNIIMILAIIILLKINQQKYMKYFISFKYVVSISYGIYWYIIIYALPRV
ncbi:MAG: hypothetical protein WC152_07825 [Candidatus Izemoplasmatales bacterium]